MQAPAIVLSDRDRRKLEHIERAASAEQRQVLRARIVLRAAEDQTNTELGKSLDIDRKTVGKWRRRFAEAGLDGLVDQPRSGRPTKVSAVARCQILAMACCLPETGATVGEQAQHAFAKMMKKVDVPEPDQQVVQAAVATIAEAVGNGLESCDTPARSHWTIASLTEAVLEAEILQQVSCSTIWRQLHEVDIRPHRHKMWLHSPDPHFKERVTHICDLYLDPPADSTVICVDEKTGMQILERKYADRRGGPGRLARREVEYVRHGTLCLFAGFEVHTGRVFGRVRDGRTAWDTHCFMEELARWRPEGFIDIIWDNLNTHHGQQWQRFNEQHGHRFRFHYTPLHASWVNQVECFFSILARRVLRRGSFSCGPDLAWKIKTFLEQYNEREAKPFRWTFKGYPLQTGLEKAAA